MMVIGAVGALALIIGGKQPLVFHGRIYFEIGRAWAAVSLAGAVLGFLYGLAALGVVGLLMALYAGIIALWVFRREIPQYAGGAYVDYDAIWFEGAATRRGEKCFSVLMCAKRKEASASFFFLQKNIRSAWERKDGRMGKLLMKNSGGRLGADFQKHPANPRKSMKKRASSPFFWRGERDLKLVLSFDPF